MSLIFLSHSSANNVEAVALRDWLRREGWDDVFLDVDPDGIAAGERWERKLNEAALRCEAVLFLVSRNWLSSEWCLKEFNLAHRLNKKLFGLLIEDLHAADLPANLTSTWQLVRLCDGTDHIMQRVIMPFSGKEAHVTFSAEALGRLKTGLQRAGLAPHFFAWPPEGDPNRSPFRGLKSMEADDAGIFFGRDAPILEALDKLRGFRNTAPPRLLVILGASGAGKSSFLRAGILPRLRRDDQNFLPLPVIRPESAVISGETGLLHSLETAFELARFAKQRAHLRAAIQGGATTLKPLLQELADKATPLVPQDSDASPRAPILVLPIDQGEELFLSEAQEEVRHFLSLIRDLLIADTPAVTAIFTIRSDNYERLQLIKELDGVLQQTLSLPPMPKGSYAEVIKGPLQRLDGTTRAVKIEDGLVDAILTDLEAGGAKDALPLLAFVLERLYDDYRAGGYLKLAHYNELGGIKGSIEVAVERAFKAADADPRIPKAPLARMALLRRGLIPWLAGIDPDTGAPRRRIARLSEIPIEARPLIEHLVEQRLLATDVAGDTSEKTIEPAHEALLRKWGLLQGWLAEDAGILGVLEGVKRASRDWAANGKNPAWLAHSSERIEAAERLLERPDLAANLEPTDREYLAACRNAQATSRSRTRRMRVSVSVLLACIALGLFGWINQSLIRDELHWYLTMRPYKKAKFDPYVLKTDAERALRPKDAFRECAKNCPEMVVVPPGEFVMGSPATEKGRYTNEGPQHRVVLRQPLALSKFDVTFDDWDACVTAGGCPIDGRAADSGWGRGNRPVVYVSWNDAQQYVAWLSRMTGKQYRLPTEAEWEYAARAGTTSAYFWGNELGKGNANCDGCGSQWDKRQTAPVGSFKSNAFGLHDMAGNAWQWVQDCYQANYNDAPDDGSARNTGDCKSRVVRGGSWLNIPPNVRVAVRYRFSNDSRTNIVGFRIARTLGDAR